METPIALHSVAHRVSHQIPAESEMSRQNRATPPEMKVLHLFPDPPVAVSSHSQQAGGQGGGVAAGWWRVSRHFLGSENRSRYRGVSQLQSHQSRYSVQLSAFSNAPFFEFLILSETSRRLWRFLGSVRGFPRKTPGKSCKNRWKAFPESQNAQSPPKGAGKLVPRENCRKVSKPFLTLFDVFCPARKLSKNVENICWHFLTIFDVFWRGPFPLAPFAVRWNATNSRILVPGKANLPGTLGQHCLDLVNTFRAGGCFLKSTVQAFSSFSHTKAKTFCKDIGVWFFVRNFVAQKVFRANFALRTCHPNTLARLSKSIGI